MPNQIFKQTKLQQQFQSPSGVKDVVKNATGTVEKVLGLDKTNAVMGTSMQISSNISIPSIDAVKNLDIKKIAQDALSNGVEARKYNTSPILGFDQATATLGVGKKDEPISVAFQIGDDFSIGQNSRVRAVVGPELALEKDQSGKAYVDPSIKATFDVIRDGNNKKGKPHRDYRLDVDMGLPKNPSTGNTGIEYDVDFTMFGRAKKENGVQTTTTIGVSNKGGKVTPEITFGVNLNIGNNNHQKTNNTEAEAGDNEKKPFKPLEAIKDVAEGAWKGVKAVGKKVGEAVDGVADKVKDIFTKDDAEKDERDAKKAERDREKQERKDKKGQDKGDNKEDAKGDIEDEKKHKEKPAKEEKPGKAEREDKGRDESGKVDKEPKNKLEKVPEPNNKKNDIDRDAKRQANEKEKEAEQKAREEEKLAKQQAKEGRQEDRQKAKEVEQKQREEAKAKEDTKKDHSSDKGKVEDSKEKKDSKPAKLDPRAEASTPEKPKNNTIVIEIPVEIVPSKSRSMEEDGAAKKTQGQVSQEIHKITLTAGKGEVVDTKEDREVSNEEKASKTSVTEKGGKKLLEFKYLTNKAANLLIEDIKNQLADPLDHSDIQAELRLGYELITNPELDRILRQDKTLEPYLNGFKELASKVTGTRYETNIDKTQQTGNSNGRQ
jgi:hypothetical protein